MCICVEAWGTRRAKGQALFAGDIIEAGLEMITVVSPSSSHCKSSIKLTCKYHSGGGRYGRPPRIPSCSTAERGLYADRFCT